MNGMSPRELATVLAALRFWGRSGMAIYGKAACPHHFTEHEPLDDEEIHTLCEKLSLGETEG